MQYDTVKSKGFTIVELLIVVVVIAILAAITIVSYNGISQRSKQTALQTTLSQVARQVSVEKTLTGEFPASLNELNDNRGPSVGSDIQFAYTTTPDDYCMTIVSTAITTTYHICGSVGKITEGTYGPHIAMLGGGPTRDGFSDLTLNMGSGDTITADLSPIPTGAWMIIVLGYGVPALEAPPAGWTALEPRKTTNTLQTAIFAKIKQAGDDSNLVIEAPGMTGASSLNAVLLWGRNVAAVNTWTVGSWGERLVNASSTTVLTPTVNVTTAKSLVLSIAVERTTAEETNYTSLTGVSPWIWIPHQPAENTNKMHTIAIGYEEKNTPGTSQAMTVTYPNSQTFNAHAIQLVLPPAS